MYMVVTKFMEPVYFPADEVGFKDAFVSAIAIMAATQDLVSVVKYSPIGWSYTNLESFNIVRP